MALCLVAAIVFGVMSLFSARYRPLAKEGFQCAFRMLTFRKCDAHLEEKLKAGITGRLMMYHPGFASKVYHNFKILSWIFTIIFFASMIYTGYAIYNLVTIGTCDPSGGQCIFLPAESTPGSASVSANVSAPVSSGCVNADAPGSATPYFDNNASVEFFYRDGCIWCQKEQEVLTLLAKDGYRVKPMHLDSNPQYWKEYNIVATPTFIGPDGKKVIGYQEYMPLKALLDSYK